jgi:hypothetical protein
MDSGLRRNDTVGGLSLEQTLLDHRHMRQGIDLDGAGRVIHALGAGQGIEPVDIHRARAANALAAGAAQSQGGVDLVLDPEQAIQNHRATIVQIDEIGIDARIG